MKIVVVGLRGFPNIQGGVETHCEELFPRIVAQGCDVTVVRRKGFVKEDPPMKTYKGVTFKDIVSPKVVGLEAALHTFFGICYARKVKADIVHIHAIGPAITVPVAKMLGLKVVVTHHGPDYDREKWGRFAKFILRMGERFAARWADDIISISTVISDILKQKYNRTENVHLIYNGVTVRPRIPASAYLSSLGVEPKKYVLAVGRFVPEKRFDKLIEAFAALPDTGFKLVIAGDADHESAYSSALKQLAHERNVVLAGMVKGEKLYELYSNAALFVLPSSHEGLPITLLEAMSYDADVLVSNIPANKAVGLPADCYFDIADPSALGDRLQAKLSRSGDRTVCYDLGKYDWDHIAGQIREVYSRRLGVEI